MSWACPAKWVMEIFRSAAGRRPETVLLGLPVSRVVTEAMLPLQALPLPKALMTNLPPSRLTDSPNRLPSRAVGGGEPGGLDGQTDGERKEALVPGMGGCCFHGILIGWSVACC